MFQQVTKRTITEILESDVRIHKISAYVLESIVMYFLILYTLLLLSVCVFVIRL